jgi:phosphate acetyltransferase
MVKKVQVAVHLARVEAPSLILDGEWQADAALDLATARIKGVGDSSMAGQANVLVVPDLNSGNIAYKLMQRVGGCRSVGPVLWGTAFPANDLSRGCSTEDVVDMLALTTLQTQKTRMLQKSAYAC